MYSAPPRAVVHLVLTRSAVPFLAPPHTLGACRVEMTRIERLLVVLFEGARAGLDLVSVLGCVFWDFGRLGGFLLRLINRKAILSDVGAQWTYE
jgi:hypothetical protein